MSTKQDPKPIGPEDAPTPAKKKPKRRTTKQQKEARRIANAKYYAKTRGTGKKRELKPCGTYAAYRRHKRKNEQPCDPCIKAYTAYLNERPSKQKEGSE